MSTPYAAAETVDRPDDDSILELTDGENPLTFLSMGEPDTALGVISWMNDYDRIEGWRRAEIESDGQPRKVILKALEKQERALEADATLPVYHDRHRRSTTIVDAEPTPDLETPNPDATTDPVPATDGGTTLADNDSSTDETADTPESDEVHPDTKGLEAGQVARIDRESSTEFVWPATTACEEPYLMRAFDAEGDERTDEPIALSKDEYRTRMDFDRDTMAVGLTDTQAPTLAATNGGDA